MSTMKIATFIINTFGGGGQKFYCCEGFQAAPARPSSKGLSGSK
jgi:hypothetical protein